MTTITSYSDPSLVMGLVWVECAVERVGVGVWGGGVLHYYTNMICLKGA